MEYKHILFEVADGVATITINRPGFFVRDARWSGDKIAVYVSCPNDKNGKIFLYYSFVGYKVIN